MVGNRGDAAKQTGRQAGRYPGLVYHCTVQLSFGSGACNGGFSSC